MTATLRKISVLIALFVTVVFAVFLFNQTVQIVQSARSVNPVFGDGVMWALIFIYCVLLITPVVLWFKVPKRMSPPAIAEGEEYDRFMLDFRRRLSRNARLRGVPLSTPEHVESAVQLLDKHADEVVASTASAVFLSTAVLQSGRLDVLVVFAAQTRLIWQIAHVYYQRPSLRDFVQLYANVASTAFIAAGIEECGHRCSGGDGIWFDGCSHSRNAHSHKLDPDGLRKCFSHFACRDDHEGILPLHNEDR